MESGILLFPIFMVFHQNCYFLAFFCKFVDTYTKLVSCFTKF